MSVGCSATVVVLLIACLAQGTLIGSSIGQFAPDVRHLEPVAPGGLH